MTAMQLTKERIDSGDYTQDELLDWHEMANDPVHINSLSKLPKESFENITTYKENNYEYTMGERNGINVIIDVRSTLFDFQKPDTTKVKEDFSNMVEGVQNFASGTRFGLVKAYNNAKTILNEASGGRLKQFEDIVNSAGKNLFDIDVKIPIESLRPENDTLGSMTGEITGQYIIPGAFVYKYIPNILLAEPVVVGLFSGKDDGNLANVFQEFFPEFTENNKIANIIANGLATNENDDEVGARIKNIVADSPIGIFADTIFRSLKYFKNNPDKLEEVQNEFKSAGAAATPEELKKNFTSTQPFYSNVVNAIRDIDIPEGGMDVTQFTNTIRNTPGVKQSELDDMGFDGFFLDDQPAIVTQERVNEFLETKDLSKNVNTTVLGEDKFDTGLLFMDKDATIPSALKGVKTFEDAKLIIMNDEPLYNQMREYYKKYIDENNIAFPIAYDDLYGRDLDNIVQKFLDNEFKIGSMSSTPTQTKFDDYVLPGGEDYKEMLLTTKGTQIFTKDHFRKAGVDGIPEGENILAHVRFNTRDIDGKKVLFIEEIQSDLHQAGRRFGYNTIGSEITVGKPNVPDAPFKKNWHELSMKRIIKYAIDNGFDGISFTPGKVQAERYDLSKQLDEIFYNETFGSLNGYKNGESVFYQQNITKDNLADYVGKDIAQKLLDAPVEKVTQKTDENIVGKRLSGVELQVGGEGMIGFYDQILPKFVNKFSKKYGAKLENVDLKSTKFVNPNNLQLDEIYEISDNMRIRITKEHGSKFNVETSYDFDPFEPANSFTTFAGAQVYAYKEISPNLKLDASQSVPYLEFTPEMINTIKSEGVPVAAVKDRETSATRTV